MGEYQRGLARSGRDLPVDVTMVARQKTGSARIGRIEHLGASKRPRALTLYLENPFGENLFDHPRALARCVIGLVRKGVRGREDGEWKYGRQATADRSQKSATHWAPLSRCDLNPGDTLLVHPLRLPVRGEIKSIFHKFRGLAILHGHLPTGATIHAVSRVGPAPHAVYVPRTGGL